MTEVRVTEGGDVRITDSGEDRVIEGAVPSPAAGIAMFDGVTLFIEIALSAATGTYGAWDSGLWDTATWGPDVIWTDVSPYLRAVTTNRRFGRDLQAWESGTATLILDNRDGRFSPSNLAGPYVSAGVTSVRPWRPVRVRALYAGVTQYVFQGYAVAFQEQYAGGKTSDAYVNVPCVDELARLAGFNGFEQTPQGAGETSGRRVQRLLNNAGHTGPRAVDVGRNTMQATTLAANAVTDLKLTVDSEGGSLFIDADSTVRFENQYALIENTRSNTIQATFTDTAQPSYSDITVAYDGDLLTNIARFARVGGTAQAASDPTSRALYGDRQATRTDLICESDAQVAGLAAWCVARYKNPEERVTSIELKPRANPAAFYPQVLGRKVRDLIRVVRNPPGGFTITQDNFIAGITHTITVDNWITRFELWSATPYTGFTTSRWDTAVWDSASFFF